MFIWLVTEYELCKFERAVAESWKELFQVSAFVLHLLSRIIQVHAEMISFIQFNTKRAVT